MILYHGSPNKFNIFDASKIRTNGTTEGVGYYFTDNIKIAKAYGQDGYIYEASLDMNKQLSDDKLTLTRNQAEKIIIAIDNSLGYLDNYGEVNYEGYNNVLNKALDSEYESCDTDTNFMGALYNVCGESSEILDLFHTILGYDHIISQPIWGQLNKKHTVYIALTNDIIAINKVIKL